MNEFDGAIRTRDTAGNPDFAIAASSNAAKQLVVRDIRRSSRRRIPQFGFDGWLSRWRFRKHARVSRFGSTIPEASPTKQRRRPWVVPTARRAPFRLEWTRCRKLCHQFRKKRPAVRWRRQVNEVGTARQFHRIQPSKTSREPWQQFSRFLRRSSRSFARPPSLVEKRTFVRQTANSKRNPQPKYSKLIRPLQQLSGLTFLTFSRSRSQIPFFSKRATSFWINRETL